MKSRANSSCKSSMWIFDAPVLRAFASSPRNSSSCPMLAQKAIISALYFSLIHERSTEVSNPPEYAKTIFIWVANLPANKREVQRIAKKNLAELDVGCWMLVVGCWMLDVGCWTLDVGRWMLDVGCWTLDVPGLTLNAQRSTFNAAGVFCPAGSMWTSTS